MTPAIPLLSDFLESSARQWSGKRAIVTESGAISYEQLQQQAERFGAFLQKVGVTRGDRVMVFAENSMHTVVAFWGTLHADAVIVMVNPAVKADKLQYMISDAEATALIADLALKDTVIAAISKSTSLKAIVFCDTNAISTGNEIPKICSDSLLFASWSEAMQCLHPLKSSKNIDIDLAAIIYTSGSTGNPKGVMLTHRNMIAAATSVSTYLGLVASDVILDVLPLAFDYGLYQMIMAVGVGGRLVLERSFTYPGATLGKVATEGVTVFPGVPPMFSIMTGMRHLVEFDLSSVRCVTNTAAALSESHIDFIRSTFWNAKLFSMYGLTECKRCTYLPPEDLDRKKLSVGIAIPNTECWLVDANNRKLGPGQVGQLVIRGATVMKGYWNNPEETAMKLRPGPLPGEQVLYTGDLCMMDEDGYLFFVERSDDIIKTRGEKVSPREVENALYALEGVKEAAVIGIPDPLWGEAIKAFVVPHEHVLLDKSSIMAHCSKILEAIMLPKYIEIVADLPKTTTGKIRKASLLRETSHK